MMDWSITDILDNSVAGSNSEESFAFLAGALFHVAWLDGEFCHDLGHILFVLEMVEYLLLFNFLVFEEHVNG